MSYENLQNAKFHNVYNYIYKIILLMFRNCNVLPIFLAQLLFEL